MSKPEHGQTVQYWATRPDMLPSIVIEHGRATYTTFTAFSDVSAAQGGVDFQNEWIIYIERGGHWQFTARTGSDSAETFQARICEPPGIANPYPRFSHESDALNYLLDKARVNIESVRAKLANYTCTIAELERQLGSSCPNP